MSAVVRRTTGCNYNLMLVRTYVHLLLCLGRSSAAPLCFDRPSTKSAYPGAAKTGNACRQKLVPQGCGHGTLFKHRLMLIWLRDTNDALGE